MERSRSSGKPAALADGRLDWPAKPLLGRAERAIESVPVGFAENRDIDVSDWPMPGMPFVARSPRSLYKGLIDAADVPKGLRQDSWNAERPCQNVGEPSVVGTAGVRSHEPGVSDLPRGEQSGLTCAPDLAMDRWVWRTRPLRYLGEAEFG
ncbi:MAG: hypothetical protein ACRDNZ_15210 [Streptosporangiaceae bacterium]